MSHLGHRNEKAVRLLEKCAFLLDMDLSQVGHESGTTHWVVSESAVFHQALRAENR